MRIGISTAITQPGGSSGPPAPLILDHFTGTNGTELSSHAPDVNTPGNSWYCPSGGGSIHLINSNKVSGAHSTTKTTFIDSSVYDLVLKANVYYDGDAIELVARATDNNNAWWLTFYSDEVGIYEFNGGGLTQRASGGAAATGVLYSCTFTLSGTTITAKANALTCSCTSSFNRTATNVGIRTTSLGANGYIDDFEVTP